MSQSGGDIDLTGKDSESDSLGLKVEPWLETMVIPVGPEPIALFYSNSQFLIFEEEVSRQLVDLRIIAEAVGTSPSGRADIRKCGPPYVLLPEQAAVLVEYGKIHRLKKDWDSVTASILEEKASTSGLKVAVEPVMGVQSRIGEKRRKINEDICDITEKARHLDVGSSSSRLKVSDGGFCDTETSRGVVINKDSFGDDHIMDEAGKRRKDVSIVCDDVIASSSSSFNEKYEELRYPPYPETTDYRLRLNTFRDLWRRGYYLTVGLKFGCDYLAYERLPSTTHARWLVKCKDSMESIEPLELIALSRVASQVKKYVLLAVVAPDTITPYYIEYCWWKPQRVDL